MGLWHKHASVAYLAVLLGVVGHASSEFVCVLCSVSGPELSVWRFLLGGAGLVAVALISPASRNLMEPFKTDGVRLVLVTGSLDLLMAPLAERLGAELIAPSLEEREGCFTGRLTTPPMTGARKAEAVRTHAQRLEIDLQTSYSFGDALGRI